MDMIVVFVVGVALVLALVCGAEYLLRHAEIRGKW